jgi:GxxExxY protein
MSTDVNGLKHQELTRRIIGVFYEVYNELGPGFLESVYAEALALALRQAGLIVEREMPLAVHFRGNLVGQFRADLIVGGAVLVEAKACPGLHARHQAQVLNYLRATVVEVGLLLNFGPRPGIKRILFDNSQKMPRTIVDRGNGQGASKIQGAIRSHPCPSVAPSVFSLAPADPIP